MTITESQTPDDDVIIVVVFGLPGSGKSFFASALAKSMDAHYFNSDVIRNQVLQEKSYSENEKHRIYESLFAKALEHIDKEESVVIDATFYLEQLRQRLNELASGYGISPIFIELRASEELTRQRLGTKRQSSDADFAVYSKIKSQFEPYKQPHLILDSDTLSPEQMQLRALQYIQDHHDASGN